MLFQKAEPPTGRAGPGGGGGGGGNWGILLRQSDLDTLIEQSHYSQFRGAV